MALIATVIVMMIVGLLLTIIFAEGIQALPIARQAQNYQAALQAADSGVEDYINRLDNNQSYYTLGNTDSQNSAMGGWQQVSGSPPVNEWYTYVVNNAQTSSSGVVYLTVSGASGQNPATSGARYALRTVKVGIRLTGFTNFLYFTEYEIIDPNIVGSSFTGSLTQHGNRESYTQECNWDAWQLNTNAPGQTFGPYLTDCSGYLISFVSADTLNGPVYSQDEFHMCGTPSFPQGITSYYDSGSANDANGQYSFGDPGTATDYYTTSSCGTGPSQSLVGSAKQISFPQTNNSFNQDLAATPANDGGGCAYVGPITVTFGAPTTTYPNRTMTVRSNASPSITNWATPSSCGGTSVGVPPNGLIFDATQGAPEINWQTSTCSGTCQAANVSVSGTVYTPITVGSDNNITVVGNLLDSPAPSSGGNAILGLSAYNQILLGSSSSPIANLTIDAAMVALHDSIWFPGYSAVSHSTVGTLTIDGSLAQVYRGAVGTGSGGTVSTGYAKNYSYDTRLTYLQPPYFTAPSNPNWYKSSYEECNPTARASLSASTC